MSDIKMLYEISVARGDDEREIVNMWLTDQEYEMVKRIAHEFNRWQSYDPVILIELAQ